MRAPTAPGKPTREALPIVADVFRREPRRRDAGGRLVRAKQLPDDAGLVASITSPGS